MAGDEKKPLFVFRRRSAHLANDSSGDFAADIEEITETTFCVVDEKGNRHQLQKTEYLLFNNEHVQYVLVDVHLDQSRWLLVDSWKQREGQDMKLLSTMQMRLGKQLLKRKGGMQLLSTPRLSRHWHRFAK